MAKEPSIKELRSMLAFGRKLQRANKKYTKHVQKVRQNTQRYYENKAARIAQRNTRETNQTVRNLKKSKTARNVTGFATGFLRGASLAPVRESSRETFGDRGEIKQFAPKAASRLQQVVNANRKRRDSLLSKKASTVGNIAGTVATAIAGSGATKAVGSKLLKSRLAKAATSRAVNALSKEAAEGAAKSLGRRFTENMLRRAGQRVTNNTVRRAASKFVNRVASNIAQDVAYDATIGAVKDTSRFIESGKNPLKNRKEYAKYMAGQAALNTLIGGITNAGLPALKGLKRSRAAYETVERIGKDGKVHYEKVLKNQPKDVTVDLAAKKLGRPGAKTAATPEVDIITERLKRGTNVGNASNVKNLKESTLRKAISDQDYVKKLRRNGIDGKSVKQYAKDNDRSVIDVITEDYAKKHPEAVKGASTSPKQAARDALTQEINSDVASRAVRRNRLKSAHDVTDTSGRRVAVENSEGRRILHRDTAEDAMRRNDIRLEGRNRIIDTRRARRAGDANANVRTEAQPRQAYTDNYVPEYDVSKVTDAKAAARIKKDYGVDYIEYARRNNMEPSEAIGRMKDKIAAERGARRLPEAERATARQADEVTEAATPIRRTTETTTVSSTPTRSVARSVEPETVTESVPARNVARQGDAVTSNRGTRIDVESTSGNTGQAAAAEDAITGKDVTPDVDLTWGGTRNGTMAGRSQAVDTIENAPFMTPKNKAELEEALSDSNGLFTYSKKNKAAIADAENVIERDGAESTLASLRQAVEEGKNLNSTDAAKTMRLMQMFRDQAEEFAAQGMEAEARAATKNMNEASAIEVMRRSESGKSLQASRMFNKMTGEGRVNTVLLTAAKIRKKFGVENIDIDNKLLDMLHDAKTMKDQQAVQDALAKQIWDQVPATVTEKLAAWRYLSMLGNPRTHIRNVFGNLIFMPVKGLKNLVGAGLEQTRLFNKLGAKSKTILNPVSKRDRELIDFAKEQWDDIADTFLSGDKKYDLNLMRAEGAKIFKSKALQKLYDANSFALNKEDEFFAKYAYSHSYAQYLKANHIDPKVATEEMLDKAQKYAWDEALNSTYREANALAEFINRGRQGAQLSMRDISQADSVPGAIVRKATGTVADALVPFAKTPANIMKNGVFYSPVGLIRGLVKIKTAKTAAEQIKAIDALAQGVTGSGIMAAGWLAAEKGLFTGSIATGYNSDEQQRGSYDLDRGVQEYAVQLATKKGKTNATADWAVPAAMPFFQGVELYNAMKESMDPTASATDKFNTFARILSNLGKLADPVLNLSMLSSVENAFDTYSSSGSAEAGLTRFLTRSAQSRLGQYVPTAAGQLVKSSEENTKSASPISDGSLGNWEAFGRQQLNKIPFASRFNADKSDAFGNKLDHKKNIQDRLVAFAKNALSPANIKDIRETKVDKEIQRLAKKGVAAEGLYPKRQRQSNMTKEFGGKELKPSVKDVARFNESHGKASHEGLAKLFKTKEYKKASLEEKKKLISNVYRDATEKANKDFAKRQGITGYQYDYGKLSDSRKNMFNSKLKELKKAGSPMSKKAYIKIFNECYGYATDKKYGYVAKTLKATEYKGGVRDYNQAQITTSAAKATWEKAVNLHRMGITSKQAREYAMTEDELNKISNVNSRGQHIVDQNKLKLKIASMKCSRREKWARFEINRYAKTPNPFK